MADKPSLEAVCAYCSRPQSETGPLSYRHICRECGTSRAVEAVLQMQAKRGPIWDRALASRKRAVDREVAAA